MTDYEIDETVAMLTPILRYYGRLMTEVKRMAEQAKKVNEVRE